jgi:hypothetical protein
MKILTNYPSGRWFCDLMDKWAALPTDQMANPAIRSGRQKKV